MEVLIKKAMKLGNSAGVVLPKDWKDKKVRIELVEDFVLRNVFEILKEKEVLNDVKGIYLVGSYARGEETEKSDVDVLVITKKTRKQFKEGIYDFLLVPKEDVDKNFKKSLYFYSIVREAKIVINDSLINKYKKEKPSFSVRKLINEIRSVMKINKESVKISEDFGLHVEDGIAYSVVLRLRELYLLNCIFENKKYRNKDFLKIINEKSSGEVYEGYLRVKNDSKLKNNLKVEEIKPLFDYADRLIKKLNGKKK